MDLGLRFAISVALGVFLGYWLDLKLHTSPLFIVAGVLLGAASGLITLYRVVYPDKRDTKKEKNGN